MSDSFTVESVQDGTSLRLRSHDRDFFLAEVRGRGMEAKARVGTYMSSGFAEFFTELATHWRGWKGDREWSSLEGELAIRATADRTGHVYLQVHLHDGAPARWKVDAAIVIEAGQLERLAAEARAFEAMVLS